MVILQQIGGKWKALAHKEHEGESIFAEFEGFLTFPRFHLQLLSPRHHHGADFRGSSLHQDSGTGIQGGTSRRDIVNQEKRAPFQWRFSYFECSLKILHSFHTIEPGLGGSGTGAAEEVFYTTSELLPKH